MITRFGSFKAPNLRGSSKPVPFVVGIACAEAEAGLLPRRPTVVVGQQYLLDSGRVPAGAAALWLQLQEVPFDRGRVAAQGSERPPEQALVEFGGAAVRVAVNGVGIASV